MYWWIGSVLEIWCLQSAGLMPNKDGSRGVVAHHTPVALSLYLERLSWQKLYGPEGSSPSVPVMRVASLSFSICLRC